MATSKIALKMTAKEFAKIINTSNRVCASLTGSGIFITPQPTILAVTAANADLTLANSVWGEKGNRGSHNNYADLLNKAIIVRNYLKALASYCMTTALLAAGEDEVALRTILETTGFTLALPKSTVGLLQPVENLRNIKDKALDANKFRARFKRPLNTNSARDVDSYEVWRGTTSVFAAATQIATITATTFTDSNVSGTPTTMFYFIRGIGAAGVGAVSDVLAIQFAA